MKRGPAIFILLALLQAEALLDPIIPEECCGGGDLQIMPPGSSFNLTDGIGSIGREDGESGGLLILFPEMSFGCSGTVSSWSGVVSSVSMNSSVQGEAFHLQIWRPVYEGRYDLIGKEVVDSIDTLQEGIVGVYDDNRTENEKTHYHEFHIKGSGIPFQQGDIVGFFIPPPNVGGSVQKSLGLAYRNASLQEQESMVDMMVFDEVSGDPCEAFSCKKAPRIISSVVPLLFPHCRGAAKSSNSGSGSGFGPTKVTEHIIAMPLCEADITSCSDNSGGVATSGLFAIIAGVCVGSVCLLGITANIVTFFLARRRFKRAGQDRQLIHSRTESSCPFVINKRAQPEDEEECELEKRRISNITSLADFLQYTMEIDEDNSGSNRMSWV